METSQAAYSVASTSLFAPASDPSQDRRVHAPAGQPAAAALRAFPWSEAGDTGFSAQQCARYLNASGAPSCSRPSEGAVDKCANVPHTSWVETQIREERQDSTAPRSRDSLPPFSLAAERQPVGIPGTAACERKHLGAVHDLRRQHVASVGVTPSVDETAPPQAREVCEHERWRREKPRVDLTEAHVGTTAAFHNPLARADERAMSAVGAVLSRLARKGTEDLRASGGEGVITVFHSSTEPSIGVGEYVDRLARFFRCSSECFILALIYIDRLVRRRSGFMLNSLNVHRLFITALTVASKFFDDTYYSNSFYAKVGGLSLKELNRLEVTLVILLDFRLHVMPNEFHSARAFVLEEHTVPPPMKRPAPALDASRERPAGSWQAGHGARSERCAETLGIKDASGRVCASRDCAFEEPVRSRPELSAEATHAVVRGANVSPAAGAAVETHGVANVITPATVASRSDLSRGSSSSLASNPGARDAQSWDRLGEGDRTRHCRSASRASRPVSPCPLSGLHGGEADRGELCGREETWETARLTEAGWPISGLQPVPMHGEETGVGEVPLETGFSESAGEATGGGASLQIQSCLEERLLFQTKYLGLGKAFRACEGQQTPQTRTDPRLRLAGRQQDTRLASVACTFVHGSAPLSPLASRPKDAVPCMCGSRLHAIPRMCASRCSAHCALDLAPHLPTDRETRGDGRGRSAERRESVALRSGLPEGLPETARPEGWGPTLGLSRAQSGAQGDRAEGADDAWGASGHAAVSRQRLEAETLKETGKAKRQLFSPCAGSLALLANGHFPDACHRFHCFVRRKQGRREMRREVPETHMTKATCSASRERGYYEDSERREERSRSCVVLGRGHGAFAGPHSHAWSSLASGALVFSVAKRSCCVSPGTEAVWSRTDRAEGQGDAETATAGFARGFSPQPPAPAESNLRAFLGSRDGREEAASVDVAPHTSGPLGVETLAPEAGAVSNVVRPRLEAARLLPGVPNCFSASWTASRAGFLLSLSSTASLAGFRGFCPTPVTPTERGKEGRVESPTFDSPHCMGSGRSVNSTASTVADSFANFGGEDSIGFAFSRALASPKTLQGKAREERLLRHARVHLRDSRDLTQLLGDRE
ncbi:hypothetical protein NCLIV_043920 [Neospora caninum Liverpool]|uniref:Cyclin, N-terminal domain-containing protein n=1 Tax=Neospora caninum (strain Liverpool) TaxID=572307 RepID=F0VAR9_NEOCL|nr:hypothetical protein NCLIV_043920 [Neospora caninum Liverpool]CBZ51327.1 hypothetical protein NCLIV_043920 [Neospora caninum Liverpool]CEL68643.1 TPA: cyclin, N-terminal domain-containing protein [Neospora caninum Liverpool]|eukprot:XP_003881360.1 hypothetical protein NCLIV_043920 [Neospora caninum Liverpool]